MRRFGNHIEAAILRAVTALADGTGAPGTAPGIAPGTAVAFGPAAGLDRRKPILLVETLESADWASATFVGATHRLELRCEGAAAAVAAMVERLVAGIADCEIPVGGHIVAEIGIELGAGWCMDEHIIAKRFTVNALTIVD